MEMDSAAPSQRTSNNTAQRTPNPMLNPAGLLPPTKSLLALRATQQRAHLQRCAYRACAPVTAFKVLDPDPRAVDGGLVLGLRFEVMSRGQFLQPYYVMLNRPFRDKGCARWRLHRHTVPPPVAVSALAARFLPGGGEGGGQRVARFAAEVRREIARYHNRMGVAADLRRRLGLHHRVPRTSSSARHSVVEVVIADIEGRHVRLGWANGRSARLVLDDHGRVKDLVVFDNRGRDWDTTIKLMDTRDLTLQDVAARLQRGDGGRSGKGSPIS
ncbi:centromere protein Cenp-O [Ophiocordyceps camponoti-floridani]|uniref:Centromere protein Cenp-O n=1 Tax=Ophiocordyceps camponoti-floridani TaxID=2030778 RepID=A0A8H4VBL0_9HYPO|nr:centromere protein Cenp-O [Ophiocordyceps camponoti-floridani]